MLQSKHLKLTSLIHSVCFHDTGYLACSVFAPSSSYPHADLQCVKDAEAEVGQETLVNCSTAFVRGE